MEKEVIVDGKVINLEVHPPPSRSGTPPDNKNSGASDSISVHYYLPILVQSTLILHPQAISLGFTHHYRPPQSDPLGKALR